MAKVKITLLVTLVAALAVTGCSRRDGKLGGMMNLRSGSGPDEFAILPSKPLEAPSDYAALPEPTPGGSNLTDPTPQADAVAAMGGNPARLNRQGMDRADQGIVAAASRYGVSSDIRTVLAAEDVEFRKKNRGRLLERIFGVTVYFGAYEEQTLDRYSELDRMRRSGVRTPAAPPDVSD